MPCYEVTLITPTSVVRKSCLTVIDWQLLIDVSIFLVFCKKMGPYDSLYVMKFLYYKKVMIRKMMWAYLWIWNWPIEKLQLPYSFFSIKNVFFSQNYFFCYLWTNCLRALNKSVFACAICWFPCESSWFFTTRSDLGGRKETGIRNTGSNHG